MKKITLLLFLTLSPIAIFSQTQTENYIKTTTSLSQFNGTFSNDSQSIALADFLYTPSGVGGGTIAITNNVLTFSLSASWAQQRLKLGAIKTLAVAPILSKIELGPILASGIHTGYFAKIENNNLIFYSPYFLTGVNTNISASISGGAPGVNYSVSTGSPYNCAYGGGSGTLSIASGIASLTLSASWSNTCNLKTGQIIYLSTTTIPNTELGIIKDQNDLETNYKAKIENNWLVFYTSQTVPALPTSGNLSFSLNLLGTAIDRIENITYFDGLGRPKQQVANAQSFSGKDIVTPIEYDAYGRQVLDYLPYKSQSTNLDFKTTANVDLLSYYSNPTLALTGNPNFEATTNPYSQKKFEDSPLNRVLEQAAPGNDWSLTNRHTIKMDYQANGLNEVKLYTVATVLDAAGVYNPTITTTANYAINQLYKTITKDENWVLADGKNKTTEEFKDKEGHVVLKRTYSNYTNTLGVIIDTAVIHDTYYVYDIYGNLSFVLPPKSDGVITESTLNELCYQYRYDYRNRLVEKKLPGKDWEYIVYDKLDRPILTQDGNLKALNKWLFTKYDAFNRPVYTGDYINAMQTTRALVQALADGVATLYETKRGVNTINGTTVYYSNNAFPNATNINLFTINYYDDYSFDLDGGVTEAAYGITPITNAKSLATGSKIRILDFYNTWITNIIYYDAKGRPIYNYSKNNYNWATINKVKSKLDFVGKTLETTSSHTRGTTSTTIVDSFTYHKTGKLLSQKQKINAQAEEVIVSNTYDELGQLISKGVGGKTTQNRLQTVDYTYNIRGWLKSINNVNAIGTDLFAFSINYNAAVTGVTPLYNGNISQTQWKTANDPLAYAPRNYSYRYDALNRLTAAIDITAINPNQYNESMRYDKNGNIMNLLRMGILSSAPTSFGTMDNLTYTYDTGNKLTMVEDSSGNTEGFYNGNTQGVEYTYDSNGNMKTDYNKWISTPIAYNHLNLPTQVIRTGSTCNYVYDATGAKQQKVVNGITTDYAGGFIYENQQMKFFSQPEGYVYKNTGTGNFDYIYQYKDHLGNVRLSYGDGNNDGLVKPTEIVEENNYYPFGLKQKGYNNVTGSLGNATAQKYKYNGKELQDENIGGVQLNWYDYGARNYDPALGRWMNIDPLAEKSRRFSPYTYALNNPVYFIDPDGMQAMSPIYGTNGQFLGTDNQGFNGEVLFMTEANFTLSGGQGMNHNTAMQMGNTLDQVIGDDPNNTFTQKEANMVNNAINDVVSRTEGLESHFQGGLGTPFSNELNNGNISSSYQSQKSPDGSGGAWINSNDGIGMLNYTIANTGVKNGDALVSFNLREFSGSQFTVANLQNTFVHEFGNHFLKNIPGGNGPEHAKAIDNQSLHPTWKNTTDAYKTNMRNVYFEYTNTKLKR